MFSSIAPLTRLNPFYVPRFQLIQDGVRKRMEPTEVPTTRRSLAAAFAGGEYSCEYGLLKFYALCGIGGVISCGLMHTAVVPLGLVKCHMQVDPQKYKSIFNGFSVTVKEDGVCGLAKGWAPTFIGYFMQGLCKFGFY